MATQKERAKELADKLAEVGIYALYGGGSGSRQKGHGFWLYQGTAEIVKEMISLESVHYAPKSPENKRFNELWQQCQTIKNDGKKSGNPSFWMFKDAEKFISGNEVK